MLVNKDAYQRENLTKWPVRLPLTVSMRLACGLFMRPLVYISRLTAYIIHTCFEMNADNFVLTFMTQWRQMEHNWHNTNAFWWGCFFVCLFVCLLFVFVLYYFVFFCFVFQSLFPRCPRNDFTRVYIRNLNLLLPNWSRQRLLIKIMSFVVFQELSPLLVSNSQRVCLHLNMESNKRLGVMEHSKTVF